MQLKRRLHAAQKKPPCLITFVLFKTGQCRNALDTVIYTCICELITCIHHFIYCESIAFHTFQSPHQITTDMFSNHPANGNPSIGHTRLLISEQKTGTIRIDAIYHFVLVVSLCGYFDQLLQHSLS